MWGGMNGPEFRWLRAKGLGLLRPQSPPFFLFRADRSTVRGRWQQDRGSSSLGYGMLGHESFETTHRSYIIAQSVEASRRLAGAIAGQRERLSEAQRRGELKE